jgi:hypothetical protein
MSGPVPGVYGPAQGRQWDCGRDGHLPTLRGVCRACGAEPRGPGDHAGDPTCRECGAVGFRLTNGRCDGCHLARTSTPAGSFAALSPCRRWSIYLHINGRRFGFETERRRSPRYFEARLITPSGVRLLTRRDGRTPANDRPETGRG